MTTKTNLKENADPLVGEFLESQVPEEILFVYRIVGSLRYPIIDPAALDGQINEHQDSKEAEAVTNFLNDTLLQHDFPLQGARGALEILIDRVQEFIPSTSPLLVPIGIGLSGGHEDDFSGPGVCEQVVRPGYLDCINTASGASRQIQALERLACHGRALRAVIQCNERISALGSRAIWARFNPCTRRALRRYAGCVVYHVDSGENPDACLSTYKYDLKACGHPYRYW
jgi:hypothetical protein